MSKDTFFKNQNSKFRFNRGVASVFDDMLKRSVPHYVGLQNLILNLSKDFAKPNSNIYDFGCSTGTTLLNLAKSLKPSKNKIKLIGLDYSAPILEKAEKRLKKHKKQVILLQQDLNKPFKIEKASVAIMSLVLQFVRPKNRLATLKNIHKGLIKNGALILVEKIKGENPSIDKLWTKYYYNFKRQNGYSRQEIKNKAKALEGVLIPYTLSQNLKLLKKAGFKKKRDLFFKWFNFAGILAVK